MSINTVIDLLATLTLLSNIIFIFLVIILFIRYNRPIRKKNNLVSNIFNFISKYYLVFAFVSALIAVSGSLFFSEIAGFIPCKLCWFQRIMVYPQLILLLIALINKDEKIRQYIIALNIINFLIAAYHYSIQVIFPATVCTIDSNVDCAATPMLYFGYITIPFMSLSFSLLLLCLMFFYGRKK